MRGREESRRGPENKAVRRVQVYPRDGGESTMCQYSQAQEGKKPREENPDISLPLNLGMRISSCETYKR
jgi:hypothetical protein